MLFTSLSTMEKNMDLHYNLISSPMMMNDLFQRMRLPSISGIEDTANTIDRELFPMALPPKTAPAQGTRDDLKECRGWSRTATTILDKDMTTQELQRYQEIIKQKTTIRYALFVIM